MKKTYNNFKRKDSKWWTYIIHCENEGVVAGMTDIETIISMGVQFNSIQLSAYSWIWNWNQKLCSFGLLIWNTSTTQPLKSTFPQQITHFTHLFSQMMKVISLKTSALRSWTNHHCQQDLTRKVSEWDCFCLETPTVCSDERGKTYKCVEEKVVN